MMANFLLDDYCNDNDGQWWLMMVHHDCGDGKQVKVEKTNQSQEYQIIQYHYLLTLLLVVNIVKA